MDFIAARHTMVESQVRTNRVVWGDLITAMNTVPREDFLPSNLRSVAYVDQHLHLGGGRFELSPMLVARLIDLLSPTAQDLVLVVGPNFGYTAALISPLAGTVVGQEPDEGMRHHAEKHLGLLSCDNALMVAGDLDQATKEYGPFDAILLCGAVSAPPFAFFDALVPRGRCVGVLQKGPVGHAVLWTKQDLGNPAPYVAFDATAPYLPGHEPVETFAL
jgi:protein-L-isoaspartate(D-aspartate) O-methyltransferase